jgi:subtilisin-like proprotein convertase family protein
MKNIGLILFLIISFISVFSQKDPNNSNRNIFAINDPQTSIVEDSVPSCQPFTIALNETLLSNPIDEDMNINSCSGDVITLAATATFLNNNQTYQQTQANTTFKWIIGNSNEEGQVVYKSFIQPSGYNFALYAIDVNGCISQNRVYGKIRNSASPIVSVNPILYTQPNNPILLEGSQQFYSVLTYNSITLQTNPYLEYTFKYDTVFLPDGNNVSYNSDILIDQFDTEQVITSLEDILGIRLNIEHSFVGDLSIRLICPNGQTTLLKEQFPGVDVVTGLIINPCSSEGGGKALGCSPDPSTSSICYTSPGVGWDYEFRPGAIGCFGISSDTINYIYTDLCNTIWENTALNPSITNSYTENIEPVFYGPYETFENLIGCPLNGNWRLQVSDHWMVDNGYMFNWGIGLKDSILQEQWNYNIGVDSVIFAGPNTTQLDPNTATTILNNIGNFNYSASVKDQFGCAFTVPFTIHCSLNIENNEELNEISVYPNPVNTVLNITIEKQEWSHATIELYNSLGQVITKIELNGTNDTIDMSNYANGTYILKVNGPDQQFKNIKIVKAS